MPRCINKIKRINFSVTPLILQLYGMRLYGNSSFALEVHIIKKLFLHVTLLNLARQLKQTIRQRGFAVVYMCYNTEISYFFLSVIRHCIFLHSVIYMIYYTINFALLQYLMINKYSLYISQQIHQLNKLRLCSEFILVLSLLCQIYNTVIIRCTFILAVV